MSSPTPPGGTASPTSGAFRPTECSRVAADLLLLDTGHLVPVPFVVGHEPGRILVDVPEGLFDL